MTSTSNAGASISGSGTQVCVRQAVSDERYPGSGRVGGDLCIQHRRCSLRIGKRRISTRRPHCHQCARNWRVSRKAAGTAMSRNRSTGHDRGAALVIAMLLTALGAAVAVSQMIVPLSGWLERVSCPRYAGQLHAGRRCGRLGRSRCSPPTPGSVRLITTANCGPPPPETPVEGGTIEGASPTCNQIQLKQRRPAWRPQRPNIALARTLFTQSGVPAGLVDALVDAIDRDELTEGWSSERQRYGRPLRNAPLRRIADLLDVPGFTRRMPAL